MTSPTVLTTVEDAGKLVVLADEGLVHTETQARQVIVLTDEKTLLVKPDAPPELIKAGDQGPRGIQGLPGNSATPNAIFEAGATVNGHHAVYVTAGRVQHASNDDASAQAVLGISLNAGLFSDDITVATSGVVTEPSWAWTPGLPIYLGIGGSITQVAPVTGALVELGIALTPTSMNVRIQEAINRG